MSQKLPLDNTTATRKFSELTFAGKVVHVGKLIVCICTFGFVFPNFMD